MGVKGNRDSKVPLAHLVHKGPQDKAHLVPREKLARWALQALEDQWDSEYKVQRGSQAQ